MFPLTPALSPEEREPRWPRYEPAGAHDMRKPGLPSPSPWGEGRGEGELSSRRFHGASSSEQVTLQTRGQFLAALDKNVCAPPSNFGFQPSFGFRVSGFGFPLTVAPAGKSKVRTRYTWSLRNDQGRRMVFGSTAM